MYKSKFLKVKVTPIELQQKKDLNTPCFYKFL